jgi:TatD DNase family protein
VWATAGIHPHDAAEADEIAFAEIERLAHDPLVVAIGEIGLDFFRNLSPRDAQERTFRRLLDLARRLGKPAVMHCRDAHAETLAILEDEGVREIGGIMHCFSGDVAIARRCLDLGLVISLAGPVTYPSARALPAVARFVPADRLVLETDCPFLPPQGHRGRRNEPAYLALTAARVAELRGEPLDTLGPRTSDNARRLFVFHPVRSTLRSAGRRPRPFDTYHTSRDTGATLDPAALDRVVRALEAVIAEMR